MKVLRYMLNRQPVVSCLVAILLAMFLTSFAFGLLGALGVSAVMADSGARLLLGLAMLGLLMRSGLVQSIGIGPRTRHRGKHWWALLLLMGVTAPLHLWLDRVDFNALVFSRERIGDWLLRNLATGLWEELLFRGLCFQILYRAWNARPSSVFKAATVQALLFGALHLTSLTQSDLHSVLFQVPRAALAGLGFAGLVIYSRSLWPAVLLHAAINAAGNFDNFFAGPGYVFPEYSALLRSIELGIVLLFVCLPGLWCLRKAQDPERLRLPKEP